MCNTSEDEAYPHLRALLSAQIPTCCVQMCESSGLDLIALPQCKCTTVLASTYVHTSDLPVPPGENTASSSDSISLFLSRLIQSQPCATKGFTARKQPLRTFKKVAMCRPCLSSWAVSSDDVETYDYNGDPNNKTKFSVEVKCPQCKTLVTRRAIQNLLGNSGRGHASSSAAASARGSNCHKTDDEWTQCVNNTIKVVSWADQLKKWVKKELQLSHDEDDATPSSDQLSKEGKRLRDALVSAVQGSESNDIQAVHRHEVERYEIRGELMARDPKFKQAVEDEEAARAYNEQIMEEEKEERRQLEEDERMARELLAAEQEKKKSSSKRQYGLTTESDRAEDERKSEEAARALHAELMKQDEEERRLREERDAEYAKELYTKEKGEQRKRKASSLLSPGGTIRKSPFDSATRSSRGSAVKDVGSHTDKASGDGLRNKQEGETKLTSKKNSSSTNETLPRAAGAVYEIASSVDDDEDEYDGEKNSQFLTQAVSLPRLGQPLSFTSSAASAAGSASSVSPAAAIKPSSLSWDGKHDTDEKERWGDGNEKDIDMLESMGFDREEARLCYVDACRDLEKAASMLLSALEARQRTEKEAKKISQLST